MRKIFTTIFLIFIGLNSYSQSLQLTGTPQWVNIGDLTVSGTQLTVEALFYRTSGNNIVSKHTNPANVNYLLRPTSFELTTTTQFYFMTNPFTIQANTWYHIAGTYDGSSIKYYVNGCLVIDQPASGNIVTNALLTAIGNQSSNQTEQFIGMIDEVRIWNVARTQAQIQSNMNNLPNPQTQIGLLAYYKFSNNLVNEQGNTTFNGTAVGAISYGAEPPIISPFSLQSVTKQDVTCFGLNNGSVTISASGNNVTYSLDGVNYVTTSTFSGLAPNNYTAYVRSQEGCVITQNFTITQPANKSSSLNVFYCDSYTWNLNGQTYTQDGTYTTVLAAANGCDSTITLNLSSLPAFGFAPGPTFFNSGNDGSGGTLSGGANDFNWQVANNNINGPYTDAIVMASTPASYYTSPWPNAKWISHNVSGNHTNNQDYFYKIEFDLACRDICGGYYNDPSTYCVNVDFFADNSVVELYVNGNPLSSQIAGIPPANPYSHNGFGQTGIITVSLCDNWQPGRNTIILHIASSPGFAGFLTQSTINPPPTPSTNAFDTICAGETFVLGSQNLTTSGVYSDILQNQFGCDSIVTLNLTVLPTFTTNLTENVCDSFAWQVNGNVYTQTGVYRDTLTASTGCDSILILDLIVRQSTSSSVSPISCGTYTAPDGQTYSQTGTYTAVITNSANCDETITINLTVDDGVTINETVTSCNTYLWSVNNQTYTQSGVYSETFQNINNCDSVRTLNLTINYSTTDTINPVTCNIYTAPDGQTYTQSGIYTATLTNAANCDSIITINLTIEESVGGTATSNQSICDGDQPADIELVGFTGDIQWQYANDLAFTMGVTDIVGATNPILSSAEMGNLSANRFYRARVNLGSCTVSFSNIINVIVNPTYTSNINVIACDSYFWSYSGQTYTASGTYSHANPSSSNCDSTIVLNLSIEDCSFGCIDPSICYSTEPFPVSNFNIDKKFESVENTAVYQTPLIADMNGDCIPDILLANTVGAINTPRVTSGIKIISSVDGSTIMNIPTAFYSWSTPTSFAVADVDLDGVPDIVVAAARHTSNPSNISGRLVCYNTNGSIKWISDSEYAQNLNTGFGGSLGFADFNQDGISEVYIYNEIFNAQTGVKLAYGGNNGVGDADNSANLGVLSVTVAAQLDNDPNDLELAAGYTTYKVNLVNPHGMAGNSMTPYNIQVDGVFRDGFTSVADINLDGKLDIVVASSGVVGTGCLYAYTIDNNNLPVLIARTYPGAAAGNLEYKIGPPFIGDIDGSGTPSIGITRSARLITYKYDGTINFAQNWSLNTNDISGQTGLTMFDFNQDGVQEIVYRDETFLSIINGSTTTPTILSNINCASATGVERPIVADIDASGESKICVTCGPTLNGKLEVFGAPAGQQPWAPSRGVWNQYGYHVLNINDNLTVPQQAFNNATHQNGFYNNFNVQISLIDSVGNLLVPAPDLNAEITCVNYDINADVYSVNFNVSNYINASLTAPDSIVIAFFNGNPETTGTLLGTFTTQDTIAVGGSLQNLNFTFSGQGNANLSAVYLAVNSAGNQVGTNYQSSNYIYNECDFTDNIVSFNITLIYDTIQDTICLGGNYAFYGNNFDTAGIYYHTLTNTFACDSAIIVLDLFVNPILTSYDTITECDSYTWQLNNQTYTTSGLYSDSLTTPSGCDSVAFLDLTIRQSNTGIIDTLVCNSYTAPDGQTYNSSGNYTATILNAAGCDSVISIDLTVMNDTNITETIIICDSFTWASNNQTYTQSGIYTELFTNVYGCDSLRTLDLTINYFSTSTIDTMVCDTYIAPDNQVYNTTGTYTATIPNSFNCDSVITINLTIFESAGGIASSDHTICDGDSPNDIVLINSFGSVQWQYAEDFDFTLGVTDILNADDTVLTSAEMGALSSLRFYRAKVQLGPCLVDYSNVVTVNVNPLPFINFPPLSDVCVNESSFQLNTATPTPGNYSGTGILNNEFFPANATAGTHLLTFTYTDNNGCTNFDTSSIVVKDTSTIVFANLSDVCIDASPFTLNTATPLLGTYTGNGITNDTFDPAAAGVGLHTITYTFTNLQNCTTSKTASIRVNDLPNLTFPSVSNICIDNPPITLNTATPTPGNYSGPGVSNNIFTAANAGAGTHILTYTYTDNYSCTNSVDANYTINPLPVVNFPPLNDVCLNQTPFVLNTATPQGGVYSGTGVSNNIFNPQTAGVGTHILFCDVIDNNGCTNSDSSEIVVKPLPNIQITTQNNVICVGDTATLIPSGGINYSWTTLQGNIIAGNGAVNVSPGFTTDYILRGENNLGCFNRDTITIVVNQLPTITLNATPASICLGDTATIVASGASNYNWSPLNQILINNNNNIRVSPNQATTYTAVGTDVNGCQNTGSITINILPDPIINITATFDTICKGESTTLTASGASTYVWNPNTNLSGNITPSVIANPTNSITYNVTGTSTNGCKSTSSINITVLNLPSIFVSSSNPDTICLGDSVILTASGVSNYIWTPAASLSSNTGSSVVATPTQNTTYFVTGTAGSGCKKDTSITVRVHPPLILFATGDVICLGDTATLTSFGSGGNGNLIYSWSPSFDVQDPSASITTANPAQTTNYTVTLSDNCGTTPLTEQVLVQVLPLPIVSLNASPTDGCAPLSGTLNNQSFNVSSCTWSFGNQFYSNNCNTTFEFADAGTYQFGLTIIDNQGCSNSDTVDIEVYAQPIADFFYMPDTISIINPNVRFDGKISSTDVVFWDWEISNLNNDTGVVVQYLFPEVGIYPITLWVTNENGCMDSILYYIEVKEDFAIYIPNSFTPNGDDLNDTFGPIGIGVKNTPQTYSMKIFNRWGQMVFESTDFFERWNGVPSNINGGETSQNGVYSYVIELEDVFDKKHKYVGIINVLR
jgi:gliding motility-associated-like protein